MYSVCVIIDRNRFCYFRTIAWLLLADVHLCLAKLIYEWIGKIGCLVTEPQKKTCRNGNKQLQAQGESVIRDLGGWADGYWSDDLTSPMYLMVAKSFSPTRIRVPTSKSLTSIRLFIRLQQCVQRPTMLNLKVSNIEIFWCECCCWLWIAPIDIRCFLFCVRMSAYSNWGLEIWVTLE